MTQEDRIRYARTIAIPEIGREGQRQLLSAKVLVVGCGALGNIAATYLTAAGVGEIAIADFDTVDISNLQRQIMFSTSDAGQPKCESLARRLHELNPTIKITKIPHMVRTNEAAEIFPEFDFIIDGSDNPATKFMTSREAFRSSTPCCIGGVSELSGQATTFVPGSTPYHEIFSETSVAGALPCSIGGVLGPVPGIVGSIQAAEAIKYITQTGELLTNRLLNFNLTRMEFNIFRF